jgi:hypothetical protein
MSERQCAATRWGVRRCAPGTCEAANFTRPCPTEEERMEHALALGRLRDREEALWRVRCQRDADDASDARGG